MRSKNRGKNNFPIPIRLLLPSVAISVAYAVLFAIPQHREGSRIATESLQKLSVVEKLGLQVQAQCAAPSWRLGELPKLVKQSPRTIHVASVETEEQTLVQSFADLLTILQSHRVECTAANPDAPESVSSPGVITHRVSLTGNFGNVLAALESIETQLEQALAAELFMQRTDPSDRCRWEIAFRFEESK